jgi:MFS family permease
MLADSVSAAADLPDRPHSDLGNQHVAANWQPEQLGATMIWGHPAGIILPIMAMLYLLGFTNIFLRSSFGIMAPELAQSMNLAPAALSGVASAFFFAYALMQVPTGMLLDRFGPRSVLATMLLFTTAGAAIFAAASSGEMLTLGRILMGIGCAGVFTGAFYVLNIWLPRDRVVSQIGTLNSFASLGNLCAATPLAALLAWIGWRYSYWLFTAAVAVLMVGVALLMRDQPAGRAPLASKGESLSQIFAGVRDAIRQPGMSRLLFAGLPMSSASTISGAWGAPYLKDVHGLDDIGRGNVLLIMALLGMSGHFLYGQVARHFNTVKLPILGGGIIILATTLALAVMQKPPLWLVTVLFSLLGLVCAYPTVTHAHARGLVPVHLVGRGVSITNMGVMTAVALSQLMFGWILGLFVATEGILPEHAFRAAFGVQALMALVGIAIYAPIRDVRPNG